MRSLKSSSAVALPAACLALRSEMEVPQKHIYLDHAAVAPITKTASLAAQKYLLQVASSGDVQWLDWARSVEETREFTAGMLNADPTEIALIPNTTFGVNVVSSGFPWRPGDSLVVPENEFPTNLIPWLRLKQQGVEVRLAKTPRWQLQDDGTVAPEEFAKAIEEYQTFDLIESIRDCIDSSTRLISSSWVSYSTGYRVDALRLGELCHLRSIAFFLDAIQGLGAFPLSVDRCLVSAIAADGHKWMLGPEGAGVLYLRKNFLEQLEPSMLGWNSMIGAHHFTPENQTIKQSASRYEGGSHNMAGQLALGKSIELLTRLNGSENNYPISQHILALNARLVDGLRRCGALVLSSLEISNDDRKSSCGEAEKESVLDDVLYGQQSGIVPFLIPGQESQAIRRKLLEKNFVLSVRHGLLRVAIHGYNTATEIDQLLEVVDELSS
jgi:cysteine desulfurase / selenocysteine lyase